MTTDRLAEIQAVIDHNVRLMTDEVNRLFPVGSMVVAGGRSGGIGCGGVVNTASEDGRVSIRTARGKVRRYDYRDVNHDTRTN